jgi:hypothetical protein
MILQTLRYRREEKDSRALHKAFAKLSRVRALSLAEQTQLMNVATRAGLHYTVEV